MARVAFSALGDYTLALERYQSAVDSGKMLERAVAAGAAIVADQIRSNLQALPEEKFRKLQPEETFHGLPKNQKQDLADSFGLTPIGRDKNGFLHTKAGFDGYGSRPTKQYPHGVPNQLLARAVESGSSAREKTPFVRPAVAKTKKAAVEAMQAEIDKETKKLI
jgi:hypothetical protein